MLCLGIESSCDENALALVRDGKLVAQVMATQADMHALFGGVVPELASREHYRSIGPLCDLLARRGIEQGLLINERAGAPGCTAILGGIRPDAVAVARGPGLLGSLLVGVSFAKALAFGLGVPVIGVNHLHAHLLAVGLEGELPFPALGLLASGGHTQLYRMDGPAKFTQLGRSLDDAAGEAFDKFGKAMGFSYPAGHRLDVLGQRGEADPKLFPRPYLDNDNLDFSFSGLKTAGLSFLSSRKEFRRENVHYLDAMPISELARKKLNGFERELAGVCASFNYAVAETLRAKTERALRRQSGGRDKPAALILAGGVAANSAVRRALGDLAAGVGLPLLAPSLPLCTDNAAMVAYNGWLLWREGLTHGLDFPAIARGQAVPDDFL